MFNFSRVTHIIKRSIISPHDNAKDLQILIEEDLNKLIWQIVFVGICFLLFQVLLFDFYFRKDLPLVVSPIHWLFISFGLNFLMYALSFPVLRWLWIKLFGFRDERIGILASLAQIYAVAIPLSFAYEIASNLVHHVAGSKSSSVVLPLYYFIQALLFSFYFPLSTRIGFPKSFGINFLIALGAFAVVIILAVLTIYIGGWHPTNQGMPKT
jgi:hypothetical protein